jgi:hypothetical protein
VAVRTTVDIPDPLHQQIRQQAERTGSSMRGLIIRAFEQSYSSPAKRKLLKGPLIPAKGKRGPRYPVDENPHDVVFS